jgi:hypothetical protein
MDNLQGVEIKGRRIRKCMNFFLFLTYGVSQD